MDAPSAQLHSETRDAVVRALATRRPLLHKLTADSSWLLQIPRPANAVKHGSRVYYNILLDPWFVGGQSDVAPWFSQQWHAIPSAVNSVAEVEALVKQIEDLAGGFRPEKARTRNGQVRAVEEALIDVLAISHEFTDHCHKETLLEVHPDVPVFATDQAAKLVSTFAHFRTIITTPIFTADDADWQAHSLSPLPTWLSISRLITPHDGLYLHSALLICFATQPIFAQTPKKRSSLLTIHGDEPSSTPSTSEAAECVIYTPHGIPHTVLSPIQVADPPLHTLALVHGLHDVSISAAQQMNLGAKNAIMAQRILRAKYWLPTHDEVKTGYGLIGWFLRRKQWKLQDALREVRTEARKGDIYMDEDEFDDVRFEDMGNGESRVLES